MRVAAQMQSGRIQAADGECAAEHAWKVKKFNEKRSASERQFAALGPS